MKQGLAWFVPKGGNLKEHIGLASERFKVRLGRYPNAVMMSPEMAETLRLDGLRVLMHPIVGRSYTFLIGIDEGEGDGSGKGAGAGSG